MIEESAQITRVTSSGAWVEVNRKSACAACSAQAGCGQKRLVDWLPTKQVEVFVENPLSLILSPGQVVTLGLEEGALLRASVLIYLTPLLGLIGFSLILNLLDFSETFQILGSILGLTLGFFVTRIVSVRRLALGDFRPHLLRTQ